MILLMIYEVLYVCVCVTGFLLDKMDVPVVRHTTHSRCPRPEVLLLLRQQENLTCPLFTTALLRAEGECLTCQSVCKKTMLML